MRLSDLIKAFEKEKKQWPESPNVLLDFCQYKYNKGELETKDYRNLFAQLHNKGAVSSHQLH
ncbi:hypothetical protein HNQ94_001457 [Salirhabdus euzebyi]|uniref:YppF-like protein n=1 Tax=Salirhabdus euzebyi TaxID=394506 RepID=A0A841Q3N2_9BACI|nr:YppF family protein [Salirhabdus euzebyi]MBB6453009.1 hypothetical protein [Salirhabdus euzebyi]